MTALDEAIEAFGRHMAIEKNLSDRTMKSYLSDLRQYQVFLEKQAASSAGGMPSRRIPYRSVPFWPRFTGRSSRR